jgi:hypothetical protein
MAQIRGKPPPSPIHYSLRCFTALASEWLLVPGLPRRSPETISVWTLGLWELITPSSDLWLGWGLKQTCSSPHELSNGVSHFTWTHRGRVESRLLVVRSQIASLTPGDALPSHGVKPTWGFHKVKLRKVETWRHAPGFQL